MVLQHYFSNVIGQDEERPVMELLSQGWIQGTVMKTVGNLGREPRTIYGYKNIPYAERSANNADVLRFRVQFPMLHNKFDYKVYNEYGI